MTTEVERPDPKVLKVWLWENGLSYALLAVPIAAGTVFAVTRGANPLWLFGTLALPGLYLLTAITLRLEWKSWTFRLTPDTLEMSHGWLFRKRRVVARDRIQHLDVTSGPFDRRFGLVHVVVHTAGATVGKIPGLKPERAERLREELLGP